MVISSKTNIDLGDKQRKSQQKINKTNSFALMVDMAIPMFIKKKFREALDTFDDLVFKTREVQRPGRKEPRPKRPKKQHRMNYKTI